MKTPYFAENIRLLLLSLIGSDELDFELIKNENNNKTIVILRAKYDGHIDKMPNRNKLIIL